MGAPDKKQRPPSFTLGLNLNLVEVGERSLPFLSIHSTRIQSSSAHRGCAWPCPSPARHGGRAGGLFQEVWNCEPWGHTLSGTAPCAIWRQRSHPTPQQRLQDSLCVSLLLSQAPPESVQVTRMPLPFVPGLGPCVEVDSRCHFQRE